MAGRYTHQVHLLTAVSLSLLLTSCSGTAPFVVEAVQKGNHIAKGDELRNSGKYREAIPEYTAGMEPSTVNYLNYYRGCCYLAIGKFEQARDDFEAYARMERDMAYNGLGCALLALKNYKEALTAFDQAIKIGSDDGPATPSWIGRKGKSFQFFSTAKQNPSNIAIYYHNRAQAQENLGHHESAVADCNHALKLCSSYADAYSVRANAYQALGKHDLAKLDTAKAAELAVSEAARTRIVNSPSSDADGR